MVFIHTERHEFSVLSWNDFKFKHLVFNGLLKSPSPKICYSSLFVKTGERTANAVELKFYRVQRSEVSSIIYYTISSPCYP